MGEASGALQLGGALLEEPTPGSLLVLAVGSLLVLWVSRRSLLRPTSHGFPRFFAFEAVLVLLVLNGPVWFADPLSPGQLLSWALLTPSLVLVVWSTVLLHRHGEAGAPPPDSALHRFEHTERLVTRGIYRWIRHPMYASLLFLAWGALAKRVSAAGLASAAVATVALVVTALVEEGEDRARFGDEYRRYMERTRRFVPFVW